MIINWLESIDEEILNQKIASSFNSLNKTIQHIDYWQRFWLLFILEGSPVQYNGRIKNQHTIKSLEMLAESSANFLDELNDKNEEFFSEEIHLNESWRKHKAPRNAFLKHVLNHSNFHRGQIITMARGLGIEKGIPRTDYLIFSKETA